jgi:diacylglycerol kinase family enzyme
MFRVISLMQQFRLGEHKENDVIHFSMTNNLKVQSDQILIGNVDGQVIESNDWELGIIPRGLRISTPNPRGKVLNKTFNKYI